MVATFLWVSLMKARVIVTLVVEDDDDDDDDDDDVRVLQNILTKVGAVVHIMEKENNISCVLMAQTARMLAYNLPMVREGSAKNLKSFGSIIFKYTLGNKGQGDKCWDDKYLGDK